VTEMLWMPLPAAAVAAAGIRPSPRACAALAEKAAAARERAEHARAAARTRQMLGKKYTGRGLPSDAAAQRRLAQLDRRPIPAHHAFRYDAQPPWTDQATWRYLCDVCARTYTGAELRASLIPHDVPDLGVLGGTAR